ncbi:MAG: STAS domain-containing protein [Hydrogenophaga sp.]|uniref:STAS domain-containing protein n=1 Tax=Hydrogenophaga sp. TaxID=1904254 RepID=UPI002765B11A|nr:STAS domain-containing protein [Hydrogenophaga sp.]MDP2417516.1 STAS domain-containing protein [Hydrogenophaga sp.]MDZ4189638.1 STAS domain-containing protein [Hydrogenophaga sp.]
MAKDDSSGGFLSKMVKFVRHPTTSWSELDTRLADRESEFSKAALKEMIERKKRNDFVRKREFDLLRKVRSRESSLAGGQEGARPSFFQSSLQSKPDDRAVTLKKIDEIEAQMSMQWWKTKGGDSQLTVTSQSAGSKNISGRMPLVRKSETSDRKSDPEFQEKRRIQPYNDTEVNPYVSGAARTPLAAPANTEPLAIRKGWTPPSREKQAVAKVPASTSATAARTGLMAPATPGETKNTNSAFSASHFLALDMQEIAQDPEVEEAAIRFANGDDSGAEQGLLAVLGEAGERNNQQDDWLALFDLYRATGQLALFESHAVDFVNRFSRSAPQWFNMPEIVSSMQGKSNKQVSVSNRAVWVCEPLIDVHAVGTLQKVLSRVSQPWVLDWSPVESIDLKAARALLGIFTLWGNEDVALRFCGASQLSHLLKTLTPSGQRDVDQLWWQLRMAVLRIMNRPDEFELTALDFCVTYELSPPGWEPPRCYFQSISGEGLFESSHPPRLGEDEPTQGHSSFLSDSVMEGPASDFNQLGLVELSGEIRGDPQDLLNALERRLKGADAFVISCRNLIRVDFSAAGTLLNWVSGHHAEGRMVQFVDAHRLVSAFFHVVGITEYAKVVVRND